MISNMSVFRYLRIPRAGRIIFSCGLLALACAGPVAIAQENVLEEIIVTA